MNRITRFVLLLWVAIVANAATADSFVIKDIRIEGLQRISAGAVFNVLPLRVGDEVNDNVLARSARILFKTGNFQDINLLRDEDILIVQVSERPSIASIELEGNKSIETENLMEGLSQAGLSEGSVFQRVTLDRLKVELERQYIAQGRYGARVDPVVKPLPRNRVAIHITIKEGDVATISGVNIVGNTVFPDELLVEEFDLKESHMFSFFKGDDKYSREKLSGDLEKLSSYYQDRGYVNFRVESTQVSVTPEKSEVYITVNVSEGERFTVNEVKLTGDLKVPEAELRRLILLQPGQTFSRALVTTSNELISKRLGNEGYTFANVNGVPSLSQNGDNTVDVTFYVDAGTRVYVRRINFFGNTKTRDEVLRREMRQMEGAWASGQLIENSKVRLERLGFFKGVTVETPRVPGEDDQVDVNYSVEEQPSGSIGASVGYQQGTGFVFGANLSQTNFLGTGNRVSIAANRSDIRDSVSFSFLDPYYTIDGVSRGFSLFYQQTDISEDDVISNWASDRFGGNLTFGYPTSDISRLSFGIGFENVTVYASQRSPIQVWELVGYDLYEANINGEYTQSDKFTNFPLTGSWSISTLNRGVFATRGSSHSVSLQVTSPGSDLEYFKSTFQSQKYFPLTQDWTLRLRSELGYMDAYGADDTPPFYENYYAGGFGSIRGYEDRSLGPREIQSAYDFGDPRAIGGNLLVEGSAEFIFPMPFVKDNRSFRTLLFIDAGNVFDTHRKEEYGFEVDEIRMSAGIALSWITGIGPLSFSLSKAFNDQPGDDIQAFQFSLGQPF
ncbi:outer membrane protein assembly factor BamA [Ketobacter sp.]|uniref:outer membrane protein assembly factor BamA n=1 Tax=Ketobacter sp. TaxID=2083498 RepID=UPI000F1A2B26|nr:outer membrane protein assembly factor BamA [Ketobacter sp.]RLT92660.1 MAG: outer membrane protein assembly factor BamA [Ketobacter sp.]